MQSFFGRVWQEGLFYKVKRRDVAVLLLELIHSFLSHRFKRVVLNVQSPVWVPASAGMPQGYNLGSLFS